MAKKAKIKRRARKPTHAMMVIRVAVPIKKVPQMKLFRVLGIVPGPAGIPRDLEILNAYYDIKNRPNALTH